jgi:CelD/BcsL family acetyltransferase involved in cellulose biosynthesis
MPSITSETFETLTDYWSASTGNLYWSSPFVLPAWLKVWWQHFGTGNELHLLSVKESAQVIGIAPLQLKGNTASIVGGENVCDYLDFVVTPGRETEFFNILLDDFQQKKKIRKLDLSLLRPDSLVITRLVDIARNRGMAVKIQQVDVSYEMDLLSTWDSYLEILNTKQRHEVRRKLRRLSDAGDVRYSLLKDRNELVTSFEHFMQLFSQARKDKANFMTPEMAAFFHSLATATAGIGILRIGMLEFKSQPVAAVMCFDYNNRIYLYNSGFNPEYEPLSVGLNSKVLCIKESIGEGKSRFEFLKGNEVYKQRLGGKEIPLYRCEIIIE